MRSTPTTISWAPNCCQHYILRSWRFIFGSEVLNLESLLETPFDPYRGGVFFLEKQPEEETPTLRLNELWKSAIPPVLRLRTRADHAA